MPAPDTIGLDDMVADEIQRRLEKREKLIETVRQKRAEYEKACREVEAQIDKNKAYLEAIVNQKGVSVEEYVFDKDAQCLRKKVEGEPKRQD